MFILGGQLCKKMLCYDLSDQTWTTCPDMPQGQSKPIVASVGNSIYVVFSTVYANQQVALQGSDISLQCFDTCTSTWSFKASLPQSVSDTKGSKAETIGHYMYLVGGVERLCLRYDTHSDTWTTLTQSLEPHCYGAAMLLKGKIILCGGKDVLHARHPQTDHIESYDPDTDTWTLLPVRLPKPLDLFQIFVNN